MCKTIIVGGGRDEGGKGETGEVDVAAEGLAVSGQQSQ